ncbi:MAG: CRTAC1 family protein, partial [Gemmataceae bacterium]
DLDLDGHSDIVGITAGEQPITLRGQGDGHFLTLAEPFGAQQLTRGLAIADFNNDDTPDVLLIGTTVTLLSHHGGPHRGFRLQLTGKRDRRDEGQQGKNQRSNADGIGTRIIIQSGLLRTSAENTTRQSGLAQSRLPLHFGLGRAPSAEVVRLRWPDLVTQAELNQPTTGIVTIIENNRKPTSCPTLFSWNGSRFVFVTDALGAGALGERGADASVRPPRPEETVAIPAQQLQLHEGHYLLKIAEPMDEVMYLDRLRLDVVDHPIGHLVLADERFTFTEPGPTQERLQFVRRASPLAARDHRNRDVRPQLLQRDLQSVHQFATRSWLGFAEEHFVELSFAPWPTLTSTQTPRRLFLVLAGWTEYPYPESMLAAGQAGIAPLPPQLEQRQPDGSWKVLGELGFPAGLNRVMTKELPPGCDPAAGPLRLRTNLQIFWDQIELAEAGPTPSAQELPVARALLRAGGFAQETTTNGQLPIQYDDEKRENVSVHRWTGRLTRLGDVTELLNQVDDRHVVAGPGEEVLLKFQAPAAGPAPGMARSFLLTMNGYCKDTAPTTATGGQVGPLPYRGMPTYPYPSGTAPAHVQEYDRLWNTRPAAGGAKN